MIKKILQPFMNTPKYSLFWIDLEMSGLDPTCLLSDLQCTTQEDGPEMVIQCDKQHFDTMDDWCTKTHNQSGLVQRCLNSQTTIEQAQSNILSWLHKNNIQPKQLMLAGNSVHVDRIFIKKQMPKLDQFLHYRILDVTSIKIMMNTFAPNVGYLKKNSHRALDDIKQSIAEYQTYFSHLFKN